MNKLSLGTSVTIAVNIGAALWQFAMIKDGDLGWYTMCPFLLLERSQWYRLWTSAYLHTGLLHLGINMLSTAAVGVALESRFGTLRFLSWIFWAAPLCGALHVAMAYILSFIGFPFFLRQHSVGFSGVLFALAVGEAWRSDARRSIFGFFEVPAKVYPFALLVAMQFILPNVSFLGHLAGLLVGAGETFGLFNLMLLPKRRAAALDDSMNLGQRCPLTYVPAASASYDDDLTIGRLSCTHLSGGLIYVRHFLIFFLDFLGLRTCCLSLLDLLRRSFATCCRRLMAFVGASSSSDVAYHRVSTTSSSSDPPSLMQGGRRLVEVVDRKTSPHPAIDLDDEDTIEV